MNNEEMKRSLRELCRIESVAGIDVSDDAPYGAGCALADIESGKLTMNVGTIGVTDVSLVMEIDVRAPVTFEADAVTEPLRRAAAEYGIEVELTQDTPPVYMDKNGDVSCGLPRGDRRLLRADGDRRRNIRARDG